MFNEKVLALFDKPKNVGIIKCADGVGESGNVENGQIVKIYIKVQDEIIQEAKFKAYGGIVAIAGASVLTNKIKDLSIDKARELTCEDLAEELEISAEDYTNELELCIEALISALSEYYKNQIID